MWQLPRAGVVGIRPHLLAMNQYVFGYLIWPNDWSCYCEYQSMMHTCERGKMVYSHWHSMCIHVYNDPQCQIQHIEWFLCLSHLNKMELRVQMPSSNNVSPPNWHPPATFMFHTYFRLLTCFICELNILYLKPHLAFKSIYQKEHSVLLSVYPFKTIHPSFTREQALKVTIMDIFIITM